jgi:dTMP kinase
MPGEKVKFISFEGGEGCGKTTQSRRLVAHFQKLGLEVLHTREPGGSSGAENIRNLLVNREAFSWQPETELLLMNAARIEHVRCVIQPALAQGKFVVCDRFVDSSIAYQGYARGMGEDFVWMLHNLCCGNILPDLTFFLDIKPEDGLKRALSRAGAAAGETKFEALGLEFHQAVYAGFCALAEKYPQRIVRIAADCAEDEVFASILEVTEKRFL